MAAGIPVGGWCPQGRKAEDGTVPACYPLQELKDGGYPQRTTKNVEMADGTVIFYFSDPNGGTELTLTEAIRLAKPYLLIDATKQAAAQVSPLVAEFVSAYGIDVLNIAGPRASEHTGVYSYVSKALKPAFENPSSGIRNRNE